MFNIEQKIIADAQVLYALAFISSEWRNERGGLSHEQAAIMFGLELDEYNLITSSTPTKDPDGSWVRKLEEMARVVKNPSAHVKMRLEYRLSADITHLDGVDDDFKNAIGDDYVF